MSLDLTDAIGLSLVIVVFVLFPVAWMFRMSLLRFVFLAQGVFLLALAILTIGDPSFCESGCGFGWSTPFFFVLYREFGHWGAHGFVIVWALFFIWVSFNFSKNRQ
jgi:hypothetical protein